MAITEAYANSATISTTEYSLPANSTSLASIAIAGIYQLFLDTSNMTVTEWYRLKFYETVNGNKRIYQQVDLVGVLTTPLYVEPAFALINGWDMTLTLLQGTARSMAWSIRKVA